MAIPLLDLKAQYAKIKDEIRDVIDEVCDAQWFILGPQVEQFESEIAQYCNCDFAIGVTSGTDALLCSLMAIDIKRGDEVITTPYTFFATAGSIARLGAKPVFVDIDPVTFNIDVNKIADAITDKTRAIIPVHLFGQCADMDVITEIAKQKNIVVIEDAAQAIGAKYKGKRAGSLGDIGCFSFFPSKNLGGFGDGGMITTNNPKLAEKIKMLRVHGGIDKYHHKYIGGNFRLDALQAAVLRVKLKYLDEWHRARQQNAKLYDEMFEGTEVVTPTIASFNESIYNQYCIQVKHRNKVREHLQNCNIGCEVYYPVPLHLQECFDYLGYKEGDFPRAEKLSKRSLALPIYPELNREEIEIVAKTVLEAI